MVVLGWANAVQAVFRGESQFFRADVELSRRPGGNGFPMALSSEWEQEIDNLDYTNPPDWPRNKPDIDGVGGEGYGRLPRSNGHVSYELLLASPHLERRRDDSLRPPKHHLQPVHSVPIVKKRKLRMPKMHWHGNLPPTFGRAYDPAVLYLNNVDNENHSE